MTVPRHVFDLADQALGWNPADRRLTVIQRWTGFSAGRHAFVVVTNGVITTQRAGLPGRVAQEYASAAYLVRPFTVTEGRARDRLEELGLPREQFCPECAKRLPIGGLYCTGCGLHRPATTDSPAPEAVPI